MTTLSWDAFPNYSARHVIPPFCSTSRRLTARPRAPPPGSMAEARVEVETSAQARQLQDLCAERCSMPYRAPELFNVQAGDRLDERTDIWVRRLAAGDWCGGVSEGLSLKEPRCGSDVSRR